jgi:hypothetical protein
MRQIATIIAAALTFVAALSAAPATALNARSFVSGHGNDANICTYAAPCRTFAAAYAKTNASGEISVLDPAGYGPLTISHALSIVNDGVGESSIVLIAAGNAITINAGATDAVSLRGLTLDGSGTAGTNGIVFNSGKSLTITNCVVRHMAGDGILVVGSVANNSSHYSIMDTVVSDNGNDGISFTNPPSGNGSRGTLERVTLTGNGADGLYVGTGFFTFANSRSSENARYGFSVEFGGSELTITDSIAANNLDTGLFDQDAVVRISRVTFVNNHIFGTAMNGTAIIFTYGNNLINGNGTDVNPANSLTSVALK